MQRHLMIALRPFGGERTNAVCTGVIDPYEHKQRQENPFIQVVQLGHRQHRGSNHDLRDQHVSPYFQGTFRMVPYLIQQTHHEDRQIDGCEGQNEHTLIEEDAHCPKHDHSQVSIHALQTMRLHQTVKLIHRQQTYQ